MTPTSAKPIAILTDEKSATLLADEQTLVAEFKNKNLVAEPIVWSALNVSWASYSAALIRTTWDYYLRLDDFLKRLKEIEASGCLLLNPWTIIRRNTNKSYLRELEQQSNGAVSIVPTEWISLKEPLALEKRMRAHGWSRAVVKPQVSAGAHHTYRLSLDKASEVQARLEQAQDLSATHGFMLQPYLEEIEIQGERSFLFFDGKFSHAVDKSPKQGDFRIQEDHGGTTRPAKPTASDIRAAQNALDAFKTSEPLAYARVDMIWRQNQWLLVELELTEPSLFLSHDPLAARRFADAVAEKITQRR